MKGFSWVVALALVAALAGSTLGIYWKNPANRPGLLQDAGVGGTPIPPGSSATRLAQMAQIITAMDPKAVSAIVYESDPQLAAALLSRMSSADAGKVLAALPPTRAAKLISLMSEGR